MSTRPKQSQVAGALRAMAESHRSTGDDISAATLDDWADHIEKGDDELWCRFVGFPVAVAMHQRREAEMVATLHDEVGRAYAAGLSRNRVFDDIDARLEGEDYADKRLRELAGEGW